MDEATKAAATALLNRIREASAPTCIDEGHDGWRSTAGWSELWGLGREQSRRALLAAVKAGLMEQDQMRMRVRSGSGMVVPVFRETPAK